jgi:hypothetical protein
MLAIAAGLARVCFAERDDPDSVAPLREGCAEDAPFDFAKRGDTDFAIICSPAFPIQAGTIELPSRRAKRKSAQPRIRARFSRSNSKRIRTFHVGQ